MLLMLPALVLFVGSVKTPNSTMLQGQRALKVENPARGVLRMTRHPILWSFAIWAGVGISDKTLYRHRANLMEKLGARSPGDLSRIARERGLLADLG